MIFRALFYYFFQREPERAVDTRPAANVDISQYLGRWYELARYNTPFEDGLEEVYTEYKIRPDGNISVHNFGMDNHHHRKEAHAIGYPAAEGQLKVAFIPMLRFLATHYNILAVDEFYRNALVSNSGGSCLWFLSRSPQPETESFQALHYTKHRFR